MNKPKVQSIVVQLPCLDFEAAKQFYVNLLDCTLVEEFDDILIFLMDDLEFHLWRCDDKLVPEIRVSTCMLMKLINCLNTISLVFLRKYKFITGHGE